ncbi:hypothetical protein AHAS_Ahas07G0114600 [Arachis hypogaea]
MQQTGYQHVGQENLPHLPMGISLWHLAPSFEHHSCKPVEQAVVHCGADERGVKTMMRGNYCHRAAKFGSPLSVKLKPHEIILEAADMLCLHGFLRKTTYPGYLS